MRSLRSQLKRFVQRLSRQDDVHWLFIATFPNGGSSAPAQILATSESVVTLNSRAEGQWLVPEMSGDGKRWNPAHQIDYTTVRTVWLRAVRDAGVRPCLVVEKSPPNLCRLPSLIRTFSDMPCVVLRFTRDPYATCASWAKRYSPRKIVATWRPDLESRIVDERSFYLALGQIYGERAAMMEGLARLADSTLTYEDLVADPELAIAGLRRICPSLLDVDPTATVKVKDYQPQQLRDMNSEQIGRLSSRQVAWLTEGLEDNRSAIEALGYQLT